MLGLLESGIGIAAGICLGVSRIHHLTFNIYILRKISIFIN